MHNAHDFINKLYTLFFRWILKLISNIWLDYIILSPPSLALLVYMYVVVVVWTVDQAEQSTDLPQSST